MGDWRDSLWSLRKVVKMRIDGFRATRDQLQDWLALIDGASRSGHVQWQAHDANTDISYDTANHRFYLRCRVTPESFSHQRDLLDLMGGIMALKKPQQAIAFAWPVLPDTWSGHEH